MKSFLLTMFLLASTVTSASENYDHRIKLGDLLHDFCHWEAYHMDYRECKNYIKSCIDRIIARPDNSRRTHSQKVIRAYRLCIEDI